MFGGRVFGSFLEFTFSTEVNYLLSYIVSVWWTVGSNVGCCVCVLEILLQGRLPSY